LHDYAKDRQILISTHSPKFISWPSLVTGGTIARIFENQVFQIGSIAKQRVASFLNDLNNPHVLGTDASEVFFLEDGLILLEGQEDVLYFPIVLQSLGKKLRASAFGWGVGGAEKMDVVASILSDLGFRAVIGMLDGDKADLVPVLTEKFPNYLFLNRPAEDIRNKNKRDGTRKTSLLSEGNNLIRREYVDEMSAKIDLMAAYITAHLR
jgi:hypothetical protein